MGYFVTRFQFDVVISKKCSFNKQIVMKPEQSRAEQSRAEQSRAEQSRA
jgi:hypothetical protein